jgi:hypothetical protein
MHVNHEQLLKNLPDRETLLRNFKGFVEATEDMNVILHKGNRTGPLTKVLRLGRFEKKAGTSVFLFVVVELALVHACHGEACATTRRPKAGMDVRSSHARM